MAYSIAETSLDAFTFDGWITEVINEVKSGKEATLYCCRAGSRTGLDLIAGKVYRAREHRTFRNDSVYQEGRVILDRRNRRAVQKKTDWGREVQFGMWINYEWETLTLLHRAGADVPAPINRSDSAILMEYVGDDAGVAPLLNSVSLGRHEALELFHVVIRNVELFLACDRIHGDLSAFNILYWNGNVKIIDFPQAIDPRFNRNARDLLARDVENVCRYFTRQGVRADPRQITADLWTRFVNADL